jgi:Na+-transporting NADH:ubiquinone oxidoreductase subunit D
MSNEAIEVQKEEKEGLFSKKNRKLITLPLNDENPITVQVLGICSALAITVKMKPAIVMGLSVLFVLMAGNVIISLMRNLIPNRIRIIVQLVVVASLVILVDQLLKAYVYDVSKQLSVFVGLIITNCIIMGRFEAFALANTPGRSLLDAIGNGLGYAWILVTVAFFRELLGTGQLFEIPIFGDATPGSESGLYTIGYVNNGLMLLPPMALIIVGVIIWIQRTRNPKLIEN